MLTQIKAAIKGGVYVLLDFHPFLDESVHVRLMKDISTNNQEVERTVALVSQALELPDEPAFRGPIRVRAPDQGRTRRAHPRRGPRLAKDKPSTTYQD